MSGIYMLFNSVNNKIYIGKTQCFYKRCHQYVYDFKERKIGHLNDYLFNAMNKQGIENFDFVPVEFVGVNDLTERELHWIQHFKTTDRNYGYNIRMDSKEGLITSPETSLKMSENLKRQWASGARDQHSEKLKKSWRDNHERKAAQSALFSRYKTKYEYQVFLPEGVKILNYSELVEYGLQTVVGSFHRKKTNDVFCKGVRVVRSPLGESNEID
jgi:group I intron endonuclease